MLNRNIKLEKSNKNIRQAPHSDKAFVDTRVFRKCQYCLKHRYILLQILKIRKAFTLHLQKPIVLFSDKKKKKLYLKINSKMAI